QWLTPRWETLMLQNNNSVVNFYRISLTRHSIFNSLSSNIAGALASATLILGGCAGLTSKPDAEVVRERAQARWNALVSGDVGAAYGYLSPGTRSTMTLVAYAGSIRIGFWKAVSVDKVQCPTEKLCEADLTVEYQYMGRNMKTPSKESWIKDGSNWWYV